MATTPPVKPFNTLAKDFDPMMPQEQYDALRTKYFDDHVAPKVPKGFSEMATREAFMKQTERAPLVSHPLAAKAQLGAISAGAEVLQPLKDINPGAKQLYEQARKKQQGLEDAMRRDGISTGAGTAGTLIGSGIAFAGIEAATDGAGSALGVDELLAGVASAGKKAALAAKLSRGALAFGTYEALSDEGHHRGYAFAKGAAMGAAFDGSFTLLGRIARRVPETRPEDVEKEVANALMPDPKPMDPALDKAVSDHIVVTQKRAVAEGKPLLIKEDASSRKIRVLGTAGDGKPFTIPVEPAQEGRAIDAIKDHLGKGGSVDAIFYHPDELNSFNSFARMTKNLVPQTETKIVKTEAGQAKKVAASMNAEGIPAEPVAKDEVHVETPKPRPPSQAGLREQLATHELPDGTKLSKGEQWDYAKRLSLLWRDDIPPTAKEATARQMAGKGFERYIPEEWRRTVEQAAEPEVAGVGDETFDQKSKDIAETYAEEIGASTRQVSKVGQVAESVPEGFSVSTKVRDAKGRFAKAKLSIPQSERRIVSTGPNGKVSIKELPDRVRVQTTQKGMDVVAPYSQAFVQRGALNADIGFATGQVLPGKGTFDPLNKPLEVFGPNPSRNDIYHEGLHVSLTPLEKDIPNLIDHDAAKQISSAFRLEMAYSGLPEALRREEAFVHGATAIRMNDRAALEELAAMDKSVEHVVDMVDESARNILDRMMYHPDTMENRALEERMLDLQRRTGKMRLERWQEGAARAGENLTYNAEADTFISAHENGATVIDKHGSVADHLEYAQGGAEYAPSLTTIFEQTGMKLSVAKRGTVPFSKKDLPMAELSPDVDKFKGLAGVSALIRPTLDWAATLDQKLEAAGQKVGLFNAYKDVDDAVRSGQAWLENSFDSAARFLKGDANRIKTMFEFVAADPKHWERMLPRFGMDASFLSDVAKANEWLTNFKNDTGIQVFNYLRNDLQALRGFNFENKFAFGGRETDPTKMSFFHRLIETGELNPRDNHLGRFVNVLIRQGYETKFTAAPIAKLTKILRMEDATGHSILGPSRFAVQNYINYIRGIPDVSQQVITKAMGDFGKAVGAGFKEANRYLPKGMKLPEEFNYPGSTLNKLIGLSYTAGIGLRPMIPVRDAMQVVTNTMPVLGPVKLAEGLRLALSSEGWAQARTAGALLGRHNIGELYGDIFQEIPPHSGGTMDKALQISQMLLAPSRWGHNFGRAVAYLGEYGSAVRAVGAYRAGASDVRKLFEDTSMWFFPKPLQTRLLKDVMDASLPASEVAKRIALETVDSTLWAYRRGTQPLALRTGLGRIFGQYGMWPLNYMEFLRKLVVKRAEYPKKTYGAVAMWMATNYAASSVLSGLGGDVSKWFFLSPAGYGGSPHMAMVQNIMKAPEESEEGRAARKEILKYPLNFVPGQIEIGAIIKEMEEGGGNDTGGALPSNIVRLLGMKPNKPTMNDMSLDDRIEYEMGFKEYHGR